ncbi:MAG: putative zinc-binding peptidase [Gemmataceae bacterium]|nr:putative zinc-binding peptidase [Gemmataceae bacterium]
MKVFHCDHCEHLLFFENVQCVRCNHVLAYLPDRRDMAALEPAGPDRWRPLSPGFGADTYRLCRNYTEQNVCNWAVPADDANGYCLSCRLTRIIPDLSQTGNHEAWYRLEVAKRRLVYSLLCLDLPLQGNAAGGLVFEFLADLPGAPPVLTGHDHGRITVNVAEADDAEREKRRTAMHEGYRTLLGHFRHEVGHYYWEQLVQDGSSLGDFRERFGDERQDYGDALQRHYKAGPPADWQERFISAYASAHPWEDWAETWAHYLHITDTLETAASCGLRLRPQRPDEPVLKAEPPMRGCRPTSFERMIEQWFPLTYVLNNLNRGMGLPDGYPFVLSPAVIQKLRLVHEIVTAAAQPDPWNQVG